MVQVISLDAGDGSSSCRTQFLARPAGSFLGFGIRHRRRAAAAEHGGAQLHGGSPAAGVLARPPGQSTASNNVGRPEWTPACAAPAASPLAASRPARLRRGSRSTVGVLEHSGSSHYHVTAGLHWTGDVPDRPGAVATAMILKSLTLTNFRGIRDLRLEFSERVNLLAGVNGAGKTAILDCAAIMLSRFVGRLRSTRGTGRFFTDSDISNGSPETRNVVEIGFRNHRL